MNIRLALIATFCVNSHCFIKGSGRDTLAGWVYQTTNVKFNKNDLRNELLSMCNEGKCVVIKKPNQCTKFFLTEKIV